MRGFTLVEMVMVIVVLAMVFAFSIPAFQAINGSYMLKGASENMVAQLRLSREKAISVGHRQRVVFDPASNSYLIQDLTTNELIGPFNMPRGITMVSAAISNGGMPDSTLTVQVDGRFSGSGDIVLRDSRGIRDTVTVQISGMALAH